MVGLLKRGGRVFTHIVKNCTRAQIMPIIHGRVLPIGNDSYRWVDELRWTHCQRVSALSCFHSNDEFVEENLTSMALRVSGVLPNDEWRNSMASLNTPLCYT